MPIKSLSMNPMLQLNVKGLGDMTLKHELDGDILHVTETTHGKWGVTITRHWYYDIKLWKVSSYGEEGDTPDRPMTVNAIEYVIRHHFPKVGLDRPAG